MLGLPRCHSVQLTRSKIHLDHLNRLIDRPPTQQPEVEINNKLFPHRTFAKKLALSHHHQRRNNNLQVRTNKYDVEMSPKRRAKPQDSPSPPRQLSPSPDLNPRSTLFRNASEQLEVRNTRWGSQSVELPFTQTACPLTVTRSQQVPSL